VPKTGLTSLILPPKIYKALFGAVNEEKARKVNGTPKFKYENKKSAEPKIRKSKNSEYKNVNQKHDKPQPQKKKKKKKKEYFYSFRAEKNAFSW
jgi:hypothetical protein